MRRPLGEPHRSTPVLLSSRPTLWSSGECGGLGIVAVQVRLLGPVDVVASGTPLLLGGLRRKALLAGLALPAGSVVDSRQLIDLVWWESPVSLNALQRHISHLRKVLGSPDAIVTRSPGYLLDLGPEPTDVHLAERLLGEAGTTSDPQRRLRKLRDAIELWTGPPLLDVRDLPWFDQQARRLDELLLRARTELLDLRLTLGEGAQVVGEIESLAIAHPWHEQIAGLLMRALYGMGRQADALAAYQRLRRSLGDDLGIDPGPQLRDLEMAILRHDPALAVGSAVTAGNPPPSASLATPAPGSLAAPAPAPAPAQLAVPAQLPAAVPGFTGRGLDLAFLDRHAGGAGVIAITGVGGVGKTTLVLHWAHRAGDRFPDGRLYADLRGFDPDGGAPLEPVTVVRGFLAALGIEPAGVPLDPDAQFGLYRSVLHDRRVLVVLDNARDAAQVRPLLPAAPGCLAVVTSRSRLSGLVAREGALHLTLGPLDPTEARDLLAERVGSGAVAGDQAAVDAVVERCGGLPLALAIAAACVVTGARPSLSALAAELVRDTGRPLAGSATLDALDSGDDPASDLRSVFSLSLQALTPAATCLFALLGLHAGPDIGLAAAASLGGEPPLDARRALAELVGASLVSEPIADRFVLHDLLHAYAAELAEATLPTAERLQARQRLFDHYLHTSYAATLALHPPFSTLDLADPAPGVTVVPVPDEAAARAWFATERVVLLAAVTDAARHGSPTHAWQLAWSLARDLDRDGWWAERLDTQQVGLAAAIDADDLSGQAHTHRELGLAHLRLGDQQRSMDNLLRASELFEALGDHGGSAHTHVNLSMLTEQRGQLHAALDHANAAWDLFNRTGNTAGQGYTLNMIGWKHSLLGEPWKAVRHCRAALALLRETGDRQGEADTWDSLGHAHLQLGDHGRAVDCYQRAIRLFALAGDRYGEACARVNLGDAYRADADRAAAHRAWHTALVLFDGLGHPRAEQVRARLRR